MKITIAAVGKVKESSFREMINEYSKRLGRYVRLEIIEVQDEKTPDNASEALEDAKDKVDNAITDAKDNVDDMVDNARGSGILGVLVAILIAAAIIIAIIVMVSKNNGKYNRK